MSIEATHDHALMPAVRTGTVNSSALGAADALVSMPWQLLVMNRIGLAGLQRLALFPFTFRAVSRSAAARGRLLCAFSRRCGCWQEWPRLCALASRAGRFRRKLIVSDRATFHR